METKDNEVVKHEEKTPAAPAPAPAPAVQIPPAVTKAEEDRMLDLVAADIRSATSGRPEREQFARDLRESWKIHENKSNSLEQLNNLLLSLAERRNFTFFKSQDDMLESHGNSMVNAAGLALGLAMTMDSLFIHPGSLMWRVTSIGVAAVSALLLVWEKRSNYGATDESLLVINQDKLHKMYKELSEPSVVFKLR